MKKINNKNIGLSVFVLLSFFVTISCQDMNENFKEYLDKGEIIYSNKVDSIIGYSGKNRIKIEGYITNAFNVKEIVVTWKQNNGEQKELVVPYVKDKDTDKLDIIVPDLKEGTYEFTVVSRDASKNKSVAEKVFATAYGENYKNKLSPRSIDAVTFGKGPEILDIEFSIGNEYQRNTEVKYTTIDGKEKIVELPVTEKILNLTDLNPHKPIQYRTLYVPTLSRKVKVGVDKNGKDIMKDVETTIDLFETEWVNVEIPKIPRKVVREELLVLNAEGLFTDAQEKSEGPIKDLIDGNVGTYFHMSWSAPTPMPHYIVIDLGKDIEGFKFSYETRHNNNNDDPKKMTLFGSTTFDGNFDPANATEIVTISDGLPNSKEVQGANFANYTSTNYTLDSKIRYLWFRIDEVHSGSRWVALAELSITELILE